MFVNRFPKKIKKILFYKDNSLKEVINNTLAFSYSKCDVNVKKIVVMIPAFNEENTIADVVTRTAKTFETIPINFEIVVIDDGSTDQTSYAAKKAGSLVVEHYLNRGLAEAFRTGLYEAYQRNADIIINIDADGQYRPEDIPRLIKPIIDGKADIVLGSRFLGKIEYMPFTKRIGNRFFTFIMRLMMKFPFSDTQTGFRALSCNAAKKIHLKSKYTYTQEMLIYAIKMDLKIIEIPINFGKRRYGNSRLIFNPLSYAFKAITIISNTYKECYPNKFSARLLSFLVDKILARSKIS